MSEYLPHFAALTLFFINLELKWIRQALEAREKREEEKSKPSDLIVDPTDDDFLRIGL
jgi:hypothetical protein